jgi:hypothetical protein
MAGGSPRHSAICNNIGGILRAQLRGQSCRAYDANLKVRSTVVNRATYADAAVVCGPPEIDPADRTGQTVLNPSALIEVHRPSTEADDRGPKLLASCVCAVGLLEGFCAALCQRPDPDVSIGVPDAINQNPCDEARVGVFHFGVHWMLLDTESNAC